MKKILFLLAFTVLVACHKKADDPAPSVSNTSDVTIGFQSPDNAGLTFHIKGQNQFTCFGSPATITSDSSFFDKTLSGTGAGSSCTFKKGDHVYITCPKYGVKLTVVQNGDSNHQFSYTYSQNLAYDFIVQ